LLRLPFSPLDSFVTPKRVEGGSTINFFVVLESPGIVKEIALS
jgi:hypothetical protein